MNSATGEFERQQIERVHKQLRRTRASQLDEETKAAMWADWCRLVNH
jgi:hypothetical protein